MTRRQLISGEPPRLRPGHGRVRRLVRGKARSPVPVGMLEIESRQPLSEYEPAAGMIGRALTRAFEPVDNPLTTPKSLDTIRALCHDLRQPLAVILLLADADGADIRQRLDGIIEQAQWLSDMVENVIGRAVDDQPCSVDIAVLAARCALRAQRAAQCQIECTGVDHAFALVTPVALSRAIGCVLDNAVRAAGPRGHVTVGVASTESEVIIEVIDDGPGLGKVATNNSLGLTITRALVCACGGAFELRSGTAGGVVARIVLPALFLAIAS